MDVETPGSRPAWAQELHRVTHDLRSPLASIAGFADLLHRRVYGELNESQARAVETIHRRCDDLTKRLDGFADWLFLMTGEPLPEPAAVDVVELARFESSRLGVALDSAPTELRALAVEGPLGVALRELLHNANSACQATVRLGVEAADPWLIVEIEDDGPGPTPDLLGGETKPEGGVARAAGWLRRMGGELSYKQASPHGTIATMALPIHTDPETDA